MGKTLNDAIAAHQTACEGAKSSRAAFDAAWEKCLQKYPKALRSMTYKGLPARQKAELKAVDEIASTHSDAVSLRNQAERDIIARTPVYGDGHDMTVHGEGKPHGE